MIRRCWSSLIDALRAFAHHAVAQRRPYVVFSDQSRLFVETIEASESLKARARTIRDELIRDVSAAIAESVGHAPGDPNAHLVAGIQVATWGVAMLEAHKTYQKTRKTAAAHKVLLAIVDKGAIGLATMMAGMPYAKD